MKTQGENIELQSAKLPTKLTDGDSLVKVDGYIESSPSIKGGDVFGISKPIENISILQLSDVGIKTKKTFKGKAGKVLGVTSDEKSIEFVDGGGGNDGILIPQEGNTIDASLGYNFVLLGETTSVTINNAELGKEYYLFAPTRISTFNFGQLVEVYISKHDCESGRGYVYKIRGFIMDYLQTSFTSFYVEEMPYTTPTQPTPEESIVLEMTTSNGDIYIPMGGTSDTVTYGIPYDWDITIDGNTYRKTGTSALGKEEYVSVGAAGTYEVTIAPHGQADYGWAKAFATIQTQYAVQQIREIVSDTVYKGFADSATNTGDCFRLGQYAGCSHITSPAQFELPNTVTTIGDFFMLGTYAATGLTTAWDERNSIGQIYLSSRGDYYMAMTYANCVSLTTAAQEPLMNGGNHFRAYEYINSGVTTIGTSSLIAVGTMARYHQFEGCENLTNVSFEIGGGGGGNSFGVGMFMYSGVTTASIEYNMTRTGNSFCMSMFEGCPLTSITEEQTNSQHITFGNAAFYRMFALTDLTSYKEPSFLITSIGENFRWECFAYCQNLTTYQEALILTNNIGNKFRHHMFYDLSGGEGGAQQATRGWSPIETYQMEGDPAIRLGIFAAIKHTITTLKIYYDGMIQTKPGSIVSDQSNYSELVTAANSSMTVYVPASQVSTYSSQWQGYHRNIQALP